MSTIATSSEPAVYGAFGCTAVVVLFLCIIRPRPITDYPARALPPLFALIFLPHFVLPDGEFAVWCSLTGVLLFFFCTAYAAVGFPHRCPKHGFQGGSICDSCIEETK